MCECLSWTRTPQFRAFTLLEKQRKSDFGVPYGWQLRPFDISEGRKTTGGSSTVLDRLLSTMHDVSRSN